MKRLPEVD